MKNNLQFWIFLKNTSYHFLFFLRKKKGYYRYEYLKYKLVIYQCLSFEKLLFPESLPSADQEVADEETFEADDLGGVEEHKSIILHLLSQLKLGMDLTKVRIG